LAVLLTTLVALLAGLSMLRSSSRADTGGISAVAGGVSGSVFTVLLAVVTLLLIVLFFAVLKFLKKR
jgi:uncharacterized membrane protein